MTDWPFSEQLSCRQASRPVTGPLLHLIFRPTAGHELIRPAVLVACLTMQTSGRGTSPLCRHRKERGPQNGERNCMYIFTTWATYKPNAQKRLREWTIVSRRF
ncbi:hypothetical protein V5799_024186 [Amblyomma americanum]|uniref:Uncharacterized protein n=1 Tax=Amblyomma americanum TaxID=6943 RepID=A0AAQ4ECV0_AMBAM